MNRDFRDSHPEIPWQRIIGMRNVLAHDYQGTNPRVVYDTATRFAPELIRLLRPLLEPME